MGTQNPTLACLTSFSEFAMDTIFAVVATVVATVLLVVVYRGRLARGTTTLKSSDPKGSSSLRRQMSFVSEAMFLDMFPKELNMPAIVQAVILLDRPLGSKELLEKMLKVKAESPWMSRMWSFARRGSRADGLGSYFELIEDENELRKLLNDAVQQHRVRGDRPLVRFCETVMEQDLPLVGLLYRFYCVHNDNGHSAVVFRAHHALGDGITFMRVLLNVIDDGKSLEKKSADAAKSALQKARSQKTFILTLTSSAGAVLKIAQLPLTADTLTSFNTPRALLMQRKRYDLRLVGRRRIALTPILSLSYIKELKKACGETVTVNDVLTSAMGGALRRYIERHNANNSSLSTLLLRAMVPVAIPRRSQDMHNRWCFVSVNMHADLPVTRRRERLASVHRDMRAIKSSGEAYLQMKVQQLMVHLTSLQTRRRIAMQQFTNHSLIFSNVPGPQESCQLLKRNIVGLLLPMANVITQCIVASFDGGVVLSIVADDGIVAAPSDLAEFFVDELRQLATDINLEVDHELVLRPVEA